jgi:peroxiredoxin
MNVKPNLSASRLAMPLLIGLLAAPVLLGLRGRAVGDDETPPPKRAPSFALKDTDGRVVKLDDFTGKTLIVCFVVTWDQPSLRQIAILSDWLKAHDDKELAVLGMGIEQPGKQSVKSFVEQEHPDFPFLAADYATIQAFGGLTAVPTTFVIDKNKDIVRRYVGVTDKRLLEAALKPVPPS